MARILLLLPLFILILIAGCTTTRQAGQSSSSPGGSDAYVQLEQPVPSLDLPETATADILQQETPSTPLQRSAGRLFAGKAQRMIGAIAKAPERWVSRNDSSVAGSQRKGASTLEIVLMVFLVLAILALLDWLIPGLFSGLLSLIVSALLIVLLVLLILWLLGEL